MTLDGYFEGPRAWDLEFHEFAWGEELKRFPLDRCVLLRYRPTTSVIDDARP